MRSHGHPVFVNEVIDGHGNEESDGVCRGVILSRSNNTSRASHTDAVLFHFPEPASDENHLLLLADHVTVLPVVVSQLLQHQCLDLVSFIDLPFVPDRRHKIPSLL